jgi:hypothetical protein
MKFKPFHREEREGRQVFMFFFAILARFAVQKSRNTL